MFVKDKDYESLKKNEKLWPIFTREVEYNSADLDKHERFNYNSRSCKPILNPIVSNFFLDNGMRVEFPDGKEFAICLTHDVDEIYPPLSHTFISSINYIKNFDFMRLKNQLFWKRAGKESSPYMNIKKIIKLEEKYGAKSSFYFLATDKDIRRYRYNIMSLENELQFILESDFEVGLHGGYYAYRDLDEVLKEKRNLEKVFKKKVIGYRNHYLRFKVPDTWEILSKAGFKYDTTFGYHNCIGFRNGMCHPYRPYNLITNNFINILEINLNIMDEALFNSTKSMMDAWETAKLHIDMVRKSRGVVTVLWHNIYFDSGFRILWGNFYEKLLSYCKQNNAWMTSGSNIYNWWCENNYV
jgi:peptidoglycan/xylan/chitin deacetylase (PgdA/CDA1 family)